VNLTDFSKPESEADIGAIVTSLCPQVNLTDFSKLESKKLDTLFNSYDGNMSVNEVKRKYKMGIIYQKVGQVEEGQLFGNQDHSQQFEDFLNFIGERVRLDEHTDYSGGLKNAGTHSVYTKTQDFEIMFHVSTLMPYSEQDSQQTTRKKRIGNDVVCIIFQDGPTPFSPEIITSQFLHVYLVVQPVLGCAGEALYTMSIVTKEEVPDFSPELLQGPQPVSPDLREVVLRSLVRGEQEAAKIGKFAELQRKNRELHLRGIIREIQNEKLMNEKKQEQRKILKMCCFS